MLTLDLTNAPRWHDLAPGVRVQLRPLTTALMVATRADPEVEAVPDCVVHAHVAIESMNMWPPVPR